MVCIFFGHREVSNREEIIAKLFDTIRNLIENKGVKTFYVGNNGYFDRLVLDVLRSVSKNYDIKYSVVLAYPNYNKEHFDYEAGETIYPDIFLKTPLRFAIDKRNRWMINECDFAVTYINSYIGGAAKYVEICEKKKLPIIRLGKM